MIALSSGRHALIALSLVALSAAQSVFSLDIHPYSGPHGGLRKRSTVLESLTSKQVLYVANVTVGTPPQSQLLQITINAADTWLLASNSTYCTSSSAANCSESGSYNANSSSTYDYINSNFSVTYADDTSASGDYVTETMTIGNGTLSEQQLAVTYNTNIQWGILGLGFPTQEVQVVNGGRQYPNVPESMANAGIINSNAYSLWLNDYNNGSGSVLFGGIDTEKYRGDLMTIPLLARPANSSDLLITLSGVSLASESLLSGRNITASLDTGTTLTYLPANVSNPMYTLAGATYNSSDGYAVIDCNQQNNETVLELTFSDWVKLNISMSRLVFPLDDTTCIFGVTTMDDTSDLGAILGLTFLTNAYVVYDLSNQEISLAPAVFNVTRTNILEIQNNANGVPGAVRTPSPTSSASPTASTSPSPSPSSGSSGLSAGASAGIGVGVAVGAILIALVLFLLWRRRRKGQSEKPRTEESEEQGFTKQELPAEPLTTSDKKVAEEPPAEMAAGAVERSEAPGDVPGHTKAASVEAPVGSQEKAEPAELAGNEPVELAGSEPPR